MWESLAENNPGQRHFTIWISVDYLHLGTKSGGLFFWGGGVGGEHFTVKKISGIPLPAERLSCKLEAPRAFTQASYRDIKPYFGRTEHECTLKDQDP